MYQSTQTLLDQLETISQAAALTSQPYQQLQRAVKRGDVPALRLPGGRIAIRLEDARAFALREQEK